jgi:hypothetical protein
VAVIGIGSVAISPPAEAATTTTLASKASASVANGGKIFDTAILAGGTNPTGLITVDLFGPNNPTCTGTATFAQTFGIGSGNGSYASASFTTALPGTYEWVATYIGDTNNSGSSNTCGSSGSSVVVSPENWYPSVVPPASYGASTAYDAATNQLVLFGGDAQVGVTGNTWIWSGSGWAAQSPATSPPARFEASMAYDPATSQLVLFGGYGTTGYFNDTWTWNGKTWTQESPVSSPPARSGASLAFDGATNQLVLFGGAGNATDDDTWTWNGGTWTELSPATSPGTRYNASLAYDAGTSQLVLFGGDNGIGVLGDTWTWNGSDWAEQSPAASPPGREVGSMTYDTATGQLVLFGGYNSGFLADTWTWNGSTWSQSSSATSPPARDYATLAYDAGTSQLVLFGGYGGSGALADVWTWNGITWTEASTGVSPPTLAYASTAYDTATGQFVLFGGESPSGALADTWTYTSLGWTQQNPTTSPPPRWGASMAFDALTGQLVLFGGENGSTDLADTWTWNGSTWTKASPATSPPTLAEASMAYDGATQQLVLFGGSYNYLQKEYNDQAQTWTWNGSTWTELLPATSPGARQDAQLAYDPTTEQLLLFGGNIEASGDLLGDPVSTGDTWNWNGTTWTKLSPVTNPLPRGGGALTFDTATGQMVLFGGGQIQDQRYLNGIGSTTTILADTWTWDGANWTAQSPTTTPTDNGADTAAYDPGLAQIVLVGSGTWAYHAVPASHPVAPTVTSVAPARGPTAGGTTVTITGTSFTGATKVVFGTVAATSYTVVSSTKITAVSPAQPSAIRNIYVTTPAGTTPQSSADEFTYQGVPAVTSVTPDGGPTAGGTTVTVTGTNFTGATMVVFGTVAATSYTVVSSTKITAVSPPQAAAYRNIFVTTPAGTTPQSSGDAFTYS